MFTSFRPTLDAGTTPTPTTSPAGQALQNAYKNMNPATAPTTVPKIPSTIANAPQPAKPPTPSYNGPSINSVPHVANSLGASYSFDPVTGNAKVNNTPIKPTSIVNGTPHAPVAHVAQAAGIPAANVQNSGQTTQVMPAVNITQVKPATQAAPLNPYWQDVYNHNGLWMSPTNGETPAQFKQEVANHYGVDPNKMMMQSNGHVWIPFDAISNWAYAQSTPQVQQQASQPSAPGIVDTPPQAPTLPQIPTFDTSSIQPFQWDANQEFQNQYNAQLPAFQQQLTSESQKINDQMNNRGLYNSGIAQNAVDQQAQALYGKLFDAIQKNSLADQKQAFTEYQTNITNHLNAYKDNVDALYKSGQLSNQQYADAINVWKQQVSYAQDMYNQAMAMQKALIPYTMGPTPYQQDQLGVQMYKANLPYTSMTQYQQADMALKNRTEQFNEIVKAQQLGQAQQKINLASQSESFKEWAQSQGIDQKWQTISDNEKSKMVDQWMKQEQINLNQDNQYFTDQRNQLDNLTKEYDSTTDANTKAALQQRIDQITQDMNSKMQYATPLGAYGSSSSGNSTATQGPYQAQ